MKTIQKYGQITFFDRERVNVSNNSISSTRCHLHISHSLSHTVQAETKIKQAKLEINELCKQPSIESNQLIYVTGPNGVASSHIDVLFNIRLNKKKKQQRNTTIDGSKSTTKQYIQCILNQKRIINCG